MRKPTIREIRRLIADPRIVAGGFKPPATVHQLYEYLHLAATVGASNEPTPPSLFVTPAEVEAVKQKSEGKKVVAEPTERKSKGTVVSLMEALQASLDQSKKSPKTSKEKPAPKHAAQGKRKSA